MLDARLVDVLSSAFHVSPSEITSGTDRKAIANWDSVGHLTLILQIEETFRIRFSADEIPELTSAARIQEALNEALSRCGEDR